MKNLGFTCFAFLAFLSSLETKAIGPTNEGALSEQEKPLYSQEFYSDTALPKQTESSTKTILKAKKRGNLISLEWQHEHETFTGVFEIERSTDGNNFIRIGEAASKNQKVGFNYVFTDQHPLQVNHYRLKMVNEDGAHSYSHAVVVNHNGELYSGIQPNPFIQSFTVEVYLPSAQPIKVQLLDMRGQLLRYKSITGQPGNNKLEFDDVGSLRSGIYMVRIVRGYSVVEKKIVKNN